MKKIILLAFLMLTHFTLAQPNEESDDTHAVTARLVLTEKGIYIGCELTCTIVNQHTLYRSDMTKQECQKFVRGAEPKILPVCWLRVEEWLSRNPNHAPACISKSKTNNPD